MRYTRYLRLEKNIAASDTGGILDLVAAAVAADDKLKAVRKALVRYASDPAMVPLIHDLLDIIDAEDEPEPEFSPAERQRMHELAERLTWTCEGCGGKLIGLGLDHG